MVAIDGSGIVTHSGIDPSILPLNKLIQFGTAFIIALQFINIFLPYEKFEIKYIFYIYSYYSLFIIQYSFTIMDSIYVMSTPSEAKNDFYRLGGYNGSIHSLFKCCQLLNPDNKIYFFCKVVPHDSPPQKLIDIIKTYIVVDKPYDKKWIKLELSQCIKILAEIFDLSQTQINQALIDVISDSYLIEKIPTNTETISSLDTYLRLDQADTEITEKNNTKVSHLLTKQSESKSESKAKSNTKSKAKAKSRSDTKSKSKAKSRSESKSKSKSKSRSDTKSKSRFNLSKHSSEKYPITTQSPSSNISNHSEKTSTNN